MVTYVEGITSTFVRSVPTTTLYRRERLCRGMSSSRTYLGKVSCNILRRACHKVSKSVLNKHITPNELGRAQVLPFSLHFNPVYPLVKHQQIWEPLRRKFNPVLAGEDVARIDPCVFDAESYEQLDDLTLDYFLRKALLRRRCRLYLSFSGSPRLS